MDLHLLSQKKLVNQSENGSFNWVPYQNNMDGNLLKPSLH